MIKMTKRQLQNMIDEAVEERISNYMLREGRFGDRIKRAGYNMGLRGMIVGSEEDKNYKLDAFKNMINDTIDDEYGKYFDCKVNVRDLKYNPHGDKNIRIEEARISIEISNGKSEPMNTQLITVHNDGFGNELTDREGASNVKFVAYNGISYNTLEVEDRFGFDDKLEYCIIRIGKIIAQTDLSKLRIW